jgi:hypothetical protein
LLSEILAVGWLPALLVGPAAFVLVYVLLAGIMDTADITFIPLDGTGWYGPSKGRGEPRIPTP